MPKPAKLLTLALLAAAAMGADPAKPQTKAAGKASLKPPEPADPSAGIAAAYLDSLPDVVARFGDKEVSAVEVRHIVTRQLDGLNRPGQTGRQPPPERMARTVREMTSRAVELLIDREALLELAARDGFEPDLEAARQKAEEQFKSAEDRMPEAVAQELVRHGATRDQAIRQLAEDLAKREAFAQWVEEKIKPGQKVTVTDARQFYDRNPARFERPEFLRASHIFIQALPDASADVRAQATETAETVLQRLREGANFGELAAAHSQDARSRNNGGDLGPFTRRQLPPDFIKAAASLAPGEISSVVQTQSGLHIIKGGRRELARKESFEKVKEALIRDLRRRRADGRLRELARQQRSKARAEILLPK